jgi:hypothetical protein
MRAGFTLDSPTKLIHAVVAMPGVRADNTVLPDLQTGFGVGRLTAASAWLFGNTRAAQDFINCRGVVDLSHDRQVSFSCTVGMTPKRYLLLRRLNLERRTVEQAVLYKADLGACRGRAIGDIRALVRRDACLVNAASVCRLNREFCNKLSERRVKAQLRKDRPHRGQADLGYVLVLKIRQMIHHRPSRHRGLPQPRGKRVNHLIGSEHQLMEERKVMERGRCWFVAWCVAASLWVLIGQENAWPVTLVGDVAPGSQASATYLGVDTTTSGSWIGQYGSEGY